jgi:hypothetical protein
MLEFPNGCHHISSCSLLAYLVRGKINGQDKTLTPVNFHALHKDKGTAAGATSNASGQY